MVVSRQPSRPNESVGLIAPKFARKAGGKILVRFAAKNNRDLRHNQRAGNK